MPNKKIDNLASKKSTKISPSETIEKDQDDLMSTLESIRGLLEQSEGKLNAARKSISIANTNTLNDTSALHHMRTNNDDEEIVPILDEIIEIDISDRVSNIPELNTVVEVDSITEKTETIRPRPAKLANSGTTLKSKTTPPPKTVEAEPHKDKAPARPKENLASLTQKNLLIDALDNFQMDLEQSLREDLMKTMVSLEKNLKDKISLKIENIKKDILK